MYCPCLKNMFMVFYNHKLRQVYNHYKSVLGFYPKKLSLYQTALRHRSASISLGKQRLNNERLEFLGDAVLDAVISDYLYNTYPGMEEGRLTRIRSSMVKRKSMNKIAINMGIDKLLIVKAETCKKSESIYGNALEALIGAIYVDYGYKQCRHFLLKKFIPHFNGKDSARGTYDHKSSLFHLVQEKKWKLHFDTFEHIEENEHTPHFKSNIIINSSFISEGKGWSKKEAEQTAAKSALEKLST